MNARDVKDALLARHPGSGGQMPGPWTAIEEWRGIDLLAWSAWRSAGSYARVGYEVKVSRSDLRREVLRPNKRAENVAWCNEFYFAVPAGLLKPDEIAYEEPEWEPGDFARAPCRFAHGQPDAPTWEQRREEPSACHRGIREGRLVGPLPERDWPGQIRYRPTVKVRCWGCDGRGYSDVSRAEKEAPMVWVPRDVGLIIVDGGGCHVVKASPRRAEVPKLNGRELGQLVRWVSMRPDRRHATGT